MLNRDEQPRISGIGVDDKDQCFLTASQVRVDGKAGVKIFTISISPSAFAELAKAGVSINNVRK